MNLNLRLIVNIFKQGQKSIQCNFQSHGHNIILHYYFKKWYVLKSVRYLHQRERQISVVIIIGTYPGVSSWGLWQITLIMLTQRFNMLLWFIIYIKSLKGLGKYDGNVFKVGFHSVCIWYTDKKIKSKMRFYASSLFMDPSIVNRPQTNTKGIWSLKERKECSYSLSWVCSHTTHIKRGKGVQLYGKKVKHAIIRKILDKKLI